MTSTELLAALDLPPAARLDRRVPKSLLAEHGAPTAADRKAIAADVEELAWHAALKPTTIGVPEYRDAEREYLEIAVISLRLRGAAKLDRLVELTHRAVPYPVLLVTELGGRVALSLAHKRWSAGEAGKTVLDGPVVSAEPARAASGESLVAFREALALARQPHGSMRTLYQGWMDVVTALEAARRTGRFAVSPPAEAPARRAALAECERLEAEIARLRGAAAKESQMARRVELNLKVRELEAARAAALARL